MTVVEFVTNLIENPEDRFSPDVAQLLVTFGDHILNLDSSSLISTFVVPCLDNIWPIPFDHGKRTFRSQKT